MGAGGSDSIRNCPRGAGPDAAIDDTSTTVGGLGWSAQACISVVTPASLMRNISSSESARVSPAR
jgi:hypothetical protein